MIAAIVPAAGQSRRMGRPKLTLMVEGLPVIVRVVLALREGGVEVVAVVAPPRDHPEAVDVLEMACLAGAHAIHCPEPTPDMRATVEHGLDLLDHLGTSFEGLLLTPGDSVGVSAPVVAQVLERFRAEQGQSIVVAAFEGKRGHPLVLPRDLAQAIRSLPPDTGINALLDAHPERVILHEVQEPGVLDDLDTPDDYQRWQSP